jgi:hypothetical protein
METLKDSPDDGYSILSRLGFSPPKTPLVVSNFSKKMLTPGLPASAVYNDSFSDFSSPDIDYSAIKTVVPTTPAVRRNPNELSPIIVSFPGNFHRNSTDYNES